MNAPVGGPTPPQKNFALKAELVVVACMNMLSALEGEGPLAGPLKGPGKLRGVGGFLAVPRKAVYPDPGNLH